MSQQEKRSIIDSAFLFARRVIILAVISAIGISALFWELMPNSVKNTVTLLAKSDYNTSDDDMVPHRFRMEKGTEAQSEFTLHVSQVSQIAETHLRNKTVDTFSPVETDFRENCIAEIDRMILTTLHDELKQLGAISCQLSYWGDSGKMYRFSCKMPISEQNSNAVRMFQSIAPDAAQSMSEVVQQVRQWQEKL